jgi:glycosyltransferase involved in cell wall biosynthesis
MADSQKPMRVAVWHDLPSGGGLRALSGQVRELAALGHEVAVWTPRSSNSDLGLEWWPGNVPQHVRPFAGTAPTSRLDQRFGAGLDLFEWRRATLVTHAGEVTREMKAWNPDVLLAHPCRWFHASPIALHWDGPNALYLQEPFRPLYEASPESAWAALPDERGGSVKARLGGMLRDYRKNTLNRRQVRDELQWVRAFDRIFVNSLFSRESISRAYGVDSVYSPLGVDHSAASEVAVSVKEPFVASLGELAPHKDARLAVAAVAQIPRQRRPQLRWSGNRADPQYLEAVRADAAAMDVDFVFQRELSDGQLALQLAQAACFIFCAHLEPLGLSPLEANLAGTAVVAVAEGGVRETIVPGVNGTLVYNRDAGALGAAIDRYVSDLEWARAEGMRARDHVLLHHTWKRAGIMLEAQLRQLIAMR